jgi:hypothetical protein
LTLAFHFQITIHWYLTLFQASALDSPFDRREEGTPESILKKDRVSQAELFRDWSQAGPT